MTKKSKWAEFEAGKKKLAILGLAPAEYQRRVRELARRLKL